MFRSLRSHTLLLALLLSILPALVLSGCGQKGDLYLPEIPPAPELEKSQTESAEQDAQKKISAKTYPVPSVDAE